jgi:hypothetical protein
MLRPAFGHLRLLSACSYVRYRRAIHRPPPVSLHSSQTHQPHIRVGSVVSSQQIVDDIVAYINANGAGLRHWYVGIASDARDRLFSQHSVDEKNGIWIFRTADTAEDARIVEQYLIDNYKTQGGPGGGDSTSKAVYAYLVTNNTKE